MEWIDDNFHDMPNLKQAKQLYHALKPSKILLAALRIKTIYLEQYEKYGIDITNSYHEGHMGQNLKYYDFFFAKRPNSNKIKYIAKIFASEQLLSQKDVNPEDKENFEKGIFGCSGFLTEENRSNFIQKMLSLDLRNLFKGMNILWTDLRVSKQYYTKSVI